MHLSVALKIPHLKAEKSKFFENILKLVCDNMKAAATDSLIKAKLYSLMVPYNYKCLFYPATHEFIFKTTNYKTNLTRSRLGQAKDT